MQRRREESAGIFQSDNAGVLGTSTELRQRSVTKMEISAAIRDTGVLDMTTRDPDGTWWNFGL